MILFHAIRSERFSMVLWSRILKSRRIYHHHPTFEAAIIKIQSDKAHDMSEEEKLIVEAHVSNVTLV